MSGAFPEPTLINDASLDEDWGTVIEEMMAGQSDARQIGAHRWMISLAFRNLTRAQWASIASFLSQQRGGAETFTVTLPDMSDNPGTATIASLNATTGAAAIGATSVNVVVTGTIAQGALFKFANHDKVYMCTAERSGDGAMSFSPPLVVAVTNSLGVTLTDVPFTVRQRRPAQKYKHPMYDVFNVDLTLMEAI